MRAAILRRYNISEETYRQRFRREALQSKVTPRELVTRLHDLVRRWGKECKSIQDVFDMMVREQPSQCFAKGLHLGDGEEVKKQ